MGGRGGGVSKRKRESGWGRGRASVPQKGGFHNPLGFHCSFLPGCKNNNDCDKEGRKEARKETKTKKGRKARKDSAKWEGKQK